MKARHEYKHSLNYADYTLLRNRLQSILPRDGNTGEQSGYNIRSLYFDTPRDQALREKIDGVNHREKFRIRLYNYNPDLIHLEKKSKRNGLCYKQAERLSIDETAALLSGNYSWMPSDNRPLITELYSNMQGNLLRPKTIVDYYREPFVFSAGNVRITFDRGIKTGLFSKDILNPDVPMVSAGDELVILEVKYDAFIPQFITNILQLGNRRTAACSKYAISRIYG